MIPECQQYAASLTALHSKLAKSVEGLGTDALDWAPVAGANSLAVLVAHAVGSERLLIGQLVGGIDANRDRDAEFSLRGVDTNHLKRLIAEAENTSLGVLAQLVEKDLAAQHPHREGPKTTRWCVVHVIEHVAEHLGHAGLTRQLWDAHH
jgi:uncharacterized damage-inducible protein DinB